MEQSDVFVSYRRNDVEFTKQLVKALQATGREVWVDWEDIPPGVEGFSDEIQRGIEATDAFIAILSPSYLQSPYCLMELREALRLKKRVVPVVLQKFDPEPPPDGIGHINWVYFTPHAGQDNTFDESFPRVIEALEADHEHARVHTRLLTRAIEWERREREKSYLLTGTEIDQAESWQVQASAKSPTPTELQLNYILDSRKQQRIQQRRITISIGVLLVLAVIAGVYAVFQTYNANINAQVSHSNALASAALQPGNEDIAVALALEATRGQHASESAYKALAQVAYPEGGVRYFMKSDEDTYEFLYPVISPDGRYVIIKNKMYDLATDQQVQEFKDAPKLTLTGLFLPDGKRVILAGDRNVDEHSPDFVYLGLYDVATGEQLQKYDTGIGISNLQLSADGKTLVAYQPNGKVGWWDINSGKKIWGSVDNLSYDKYSLYTFSPDLKWMAKSVQIYRENEAGEYVGKTTLYLIETRTMKVIHTITDFENSSIDVMRFSNNSKELAIDAWDSITSENHIYLVDVESGQIRPRYIYVESGVSDVRYSPDDMNLAVLSTDQNILVLDREGNVIRKQTMHDSSLIIAEYVQDGKAIVSMDTSGVIITWDLIPGNLERQQPVDESLAAMTPDGRYLILEGGVSHVDYLSIRDVNTLEETMRVPLQNIPRDPGDGSTTSLWVASYYLDEGLENSLFAYATTIDSADYEPILSTVSIARLTNGKIIRTFTLPQGSRINMVTVFPKSDLAYIHYADPDGNEHMDSWSIASGKIQDSYPMPDKDFVMCILHPKGTYLLVSAISTNENNGEVTGGSVQLINTADQNVLFTFDGNLEGKAFFTPDGSQFVIVQRSEYGELKSDVSIYDLETRKIVNQFSVAASPMAEYKILPDGKSFITNSMGGGGGGGYNATPSGIWFRTRVLSSGVSFNQWDLSTGELIWEFPKDTFFAFFSPDAKRLYNIFGDSLAVWRFDSHDELIQWTCANRYVPEFTEKQRERFHIENDVSICGNFED